MEEGKLAMRGLSIEIVAFLYCLAYFVNAMATQNLYLQKLCSPEGPPGVEVICQDPGILAIAADVNTLRSTLRECLSFVVVLVASSWRGRTGLTRPLLVVALVGESASSAVSLTGYYFWTSVSPWILAGLDGGLIILTGGKQLFIMVCYCYIADRTTREDRTSRITFFMVSILGGAGVATASSGYILSALNYQYLFILIILLYTLCICLLFVLIEEERKQESTSREQVSNLRILLRRRPNNLLIWIMLTSIVLMASSILGESNVFIYFLQQGFNYSVTKAGMYLSYKMAIGVIGSLVFSPLATKVFKWEDIKIELITICLAIFSTSCTAFATSDLELYLFTLPEWSRAVFISVAKSAISKCLKSEEIGLFFSLTTIGEAIIPLALLPLYDWIFKITINTLPGAFFFLSSGINVIILGLLCILILFKGNLNKYDPEKLENESSNEKDLKKENNCDKNDAMCITTSSQLNCKEPTES